MGSLIVIWLVKHFWSKFTSAFLLFALSRPIFTKMSLVNERAIGKMFHYAEEEDDLQQTSAGYNKKNGSLEFMEIEMGNRM